jgi:predicted Na+-dependent transporter
MLTRFARSRRVPLVRRLWKPAVILGVGGMVIAAQFDETMELGRELLALIFLIAIAGSIYLLDIFMFKSCKPRREDMKTINDKGANN